MNPQTLLSYQGIWRPPHDQNYIEDRLFSAVFVLSSFFLVSIFATSRPVTNNVTGSNEDQDQIWRQAHLLQHSKREDWWTLNKTFKISTVAFSLVTRDTDSNQMKQSALIWMLVSDCNFCSLHQSGKQPGLFYTQLTMTVTSEWPQVTVPHDGHTESRWRHNYTRWGVKLGAEASIVKFWHLWFTSRNMLINTPTISKTHSSANCEPWQSQQKLTLFKWPFKS